MKQEQGRGLLEICVKNLIQQPEIQRFTRQALDKTPPEFFIAPSSSTGTHHPFENNGEGGLVRHTVKAALIGSHLAEKMSPTNRDIIVAACLLHDCQKGVQNDGTWKGYAQDHGLKACNWLAQFDLDPELKAGICEGARFHMYDLTNPDSEKELAVSEQRPMIVRYVQIADQMSAAEYASFIPGVNVGQMLAEEVFGWKDVRGVERTNLVFGAVDRLFNASNLEKAIGQLTGTENGGNGKMHVDTDGKLERELLDRCVFLIPEADIRKKVRIALDKVDPSFYTAAVDLNGSAYENNGRGGLVRRTVKRTLVLHDLAERTDPNDKGIIIAAGMLKDMGNDDFAQARLREMAEENQGHMGLKYVEMADQMSKDGYASWIPGVNVRQLLLEEVPGYNPRRTDNDKLVSAVAYGLFSVNNLEIATRKLWTTLIPSDERTSAERRDEK